MNKDKIDPKKSESLIVQRVLEYGLLQDWHLLIDYYGREEVKNIALNLRSLEDTALSFLCTIYQLEKEEFRCYRHRQSNPYYWNY